MEAALVFDIRRFSTHDGDGIRTTVFFKGCPLRCAWCHNPEGIAPERRVMYFPSRCIRCGACIQLARHGGMTRDGQGMRLDFRSGEDWPALIDACPAGALNWDSYEMTVEEILAQVQRDLPFFRHGGGVTLSGGEPLLHGEFAVSLLTALKAARIHTAVETALQVDARALQRALPLIDQLYCDFKLADSQSHLLYTGCGNDLIKKHLRLLLAGPWRDRVVIRTPLIPTITATPENILAISRFLAALYPAAAYELLNYNPLARDKYRLLDRPYCLDPDPPRYTREQMLDFARIARQGGLVNVGIDG